MLFLLSMTRKSTSLTIAEFPAFANRFLWLFFFSLVYSRDLGPVVRCQTALRTQTTPHQYFPRAIVAVDFVAEVCWIVCLRRHLQAFAEQKKTNDVRTIAQRCKNRNRCQHQSMPRLRTKDDCEQSERALTTISAEDDDNLISRIDFFSPVDAR